MSDRRTIRISLLSWSFSEKMPLGEFIKFLAEQWATLTPGEQEKAVAELDSGFYDEGNTFKIYYDRPETDEEVAGRVADAKRYTMESLDREKQLYQALKRKYG